MPVIAAVLFIVAYNMSEWRHFVAICKKAPIYQTLVLVLTFVLTVVFDLVVAIAVGLAVHYVMSGAIKPASIVAKELGRTLEKQLLMMQEAEELLKIVLHLLTTAMEI